MTPWLRLFTALSALLRAVLVLLLVCIAVLLALPALVLLLAASIIAPDHDLFDSAVRKWPTIR